MDEIRNLVIFFLFEFSQENFSIVTIFPLEHMRRGWGSCETKRDGLRISQTNFLFPCRTNDVCRFLYYFQYTLNLHASERLKCEVNVTFL